MSVRITVHGQPAPQGSKRHVGNGVMIEQSAKVKPWRQDVKNAAADAMHYGAVPLLAGPLGMTVVFTLPKPLSAPKRRRTWPCRRPDLDKLLRSTLDGLTGEVFADDAQIVSLRAAKAYPGEFDSGPQSGTLDRPGATIYVWEVG